MRLNKIDSKDVQALSAYLESREAGVDQQMNAKVLDIIEQVRTRKDDALLEYTEKFDHVKLDSLIMSEEEIKAVMSKVDASLIADLKEAAENIACYHEKQLQEGYEIQKEDGQTFVDPYYLKKLVLKYKDGSEYTVLDENVDNTNYVCGEMENGDTIKIVFNRMVDWSQVGTLVINDVETSVQ